MGIENVDLVTLVNPKSPEAERYRNLRTNIQYSSTDEDNKIIAVTSTTPGEGKSTTVANIAIILAQAGHKVIVIDCDQRKPNIHKIFKMSNMNGLSNYLVGELELGDAIKKNVTKNLDILTAGNIPPNPSELLGSNKMIKTIEKLKQEYDYIIIDTPPVGVVTDAQIISTYSTGVLFVIEQDKTDRREILSAKKMLDIVNANILGVVLNKIKKECSQYSYYYGE